MHLIQPSNHGLKRELKLRDLVLMQILVMVSLNLSGYAAKQGRSQVVLWLLAMALSRPAKLNQCIGDLAPMQNTNFRPEN
jgi:hypothetical protein